MEESNFTRNLGGWSYRFRIFDKNINPLTDEIHLSPWLTYCKIWNGWNEMPTTTIDNIGFISTWMTDLQGSISPSFMILYSLFNTDGVPINQTIKIDTSNNLERPLTVALPDKTFLIYYEYLDSSCNCWGYKIKQFDLIGNLTFSYSYINNGANVAFPRIILLENASVFISWQETSNNNNNILGQVINIGTITDLSSSYPFQSNDGDLNKQPLFFSSEIASLNKGYYINGIEENQGFGIRLSKQKGDFNGDGFFDLLGYCYYYGINQRKIYVLFGSKEGFLTDLTAINGTNGFYILFNDYSNETYFEGVSFMKNQTNASIDDIMIGSLKANGTQGAGKAYLIYGSRNWTNQTVDLTTVPDQVLLSKGLIISDNITTAGLQYFSYSFTSLGDINGDGKIDMGITTVQFDGTVNGRVYVFLDVNSSMEDLNKFSFDGSNGFTVLDSLQQTDLSTSFGNKITKIDDFNNDGIDDWALSAMLMDANGKINCGRVYLFFGQKEIYPQIYSVDDLNTINSNVPEGFLINGLNNNDQLGVDILGMDINEIIYQI